MKAPPTPIRLVMEAICVLREIKPEKLNDQSTGKKVEDYWKPAQKLLSEMKFLESLTTYNKVSFIYS